MKETPTKAEFLRWRALAGVDKKAFVNVNGKRYKEMGLKETVDAMPDEELFGLLEGDGLLVKRPILAGDDFVLVGFKVDQWEKALG